MQKIGKILMFIFLLILFLTTITYAHGGSISGWEDRNSDKITELNGKYFGYHKENGIRHYHEVVWDSEKERWTIPNPDKYYDENFNVISSNSVIGDKVEEQRVEVKFIDSVDGDTAKFRYNGEVVTVRFLAIDTPESVHPTIGAEPYGIEASNFTKEKLKNAKKFELEFDANADRTDNYGRYLAWVWVDGELLQDLIIQNGFAEVAYLYDDYKYTSILQASEKLAKENKLGMWAEETSNNSADNSNINNNEIHDNSTNNEGNISDKFVNDSISMLFVLICIVFVIIMILRNRKK